MGSDTTESLLVLHTTCSDDEDAQGDHDRQRSSSNSVPPSRERNGGDDITGLPIICDLLLLPENPHIGNEDEESFIEVIGNKFHPCGLSNVLMLQDRFAWEHILLSLSSCRIVIEDDNRSLPVEPIPSTFDFSFGPTGSEDHSHVAELSIQFDISLAKRLIVDAKHVPAEQDVALDRQAASPEPAKASFEEIPDPTANATYIYLENEEPTHDLPPLVESCDHVSDLKSVHSFYMDMCISPLREPQQPRQQQPDISAERRLEELLRLQDRLDKEAEYWNSVFDMLCLLGIFLLGLLFWTILRLYRSEEEELAVKEARTLLIRRLRNLGDAGKHKTTDSCSFDTYLQEQACELPSPIALSNEEKNSPSRSSITKGATTRGMEPVCLDAALEEAARLYELSNQGNATVPKISVDLVASGIGGDLPDNGNAEEGKTNVRHRHLFGAVKPWGLEGKDISQIRQRPTEGKEECQVSKTMERPIKRSVAPSTIDFATIAKDPSYEDSNVSSKQNGAEPRKTNATPPRTIQGYEGLSISIMPEQKATKGDALFGPVHSKTDSKDLSPCSKLAMEWAAQKTARRNNRRRKQSLVQPNRHRPVTSNISQADTAANTARPRKLLTPFVPAEVVEPPSVRSLSNGEEFSPQVAMSTGGHLPEPIISKACDESNKISPSFNYNNDETVDDIVGVQQKMTNKQQLLPADPKTHVAGPIIPGLCSTPTSVEGDSFVDDYW